ncbi:hypothetical protein OG562_30945 [Streptomyces sp. NBC_01275]|uniref:hypothetical protein n=1 Tax=Streptomyces sp. NBC_01275 TaxID=2903807 RepID=UPI002254752E|nr:hypothetical protein [Streptomyces sp. NBC_01275]MCX4765317.1 hypothetical protein [Streptomyces sp. NBC_01275]
MAVRVIVELDSKSDWRRVVPQLQTVFGAEGAVPPVEGWPDHMVVLFPDGTPDAICDDLTTDVPEILRAHPDEYFVGDPSM